MPKDNNGRLVDSQFSFSGGVDSGKVPTIATETFPEGLKRNQLAWLHNGTVRGGGILQRTGWKKLDVTFTNSAPWSGLFQGGWMYDASFANPYLLWSIGGRQYQIRVDTDNSVVDLSTVSGLTNPASVETAHFTQGEEFAIIQAGDGSTLPLFWDGTTLRRSAGLPTELPAATAMDYYMGRIWYAQGRHYTAGDIVGSASGTAPYFFRDAILKVTQNPLAVAGLGFVVPSQAGNIRAITHTAELDTALGQGRLYIGTRESIYRLNVPVSVADWIAASQTNQPLQTVVQIKYGFLSDRSVVRENGDLFYAAMDGIRSLTLSTRFFQQWGNTSISRNENRVLRFNDRALLHGASGIEFDNRLWQTVLPYQTPVGIAHNGVLPLDFDLITSLGEKLPPAWEGMYEAMPVLQLFQGDFGGFQRAFAAVWSEMNQSIELWEMTTQDRFDKQAGLDGNRVSWYFETPAYTWGDPSMLKKLVGLELWVDKLFGKVQFEVSYRVDQNPCWIFWHAWNECAVKSCMDDPEADFCPDYPTQPYCEQNRSTMVLPAPPVKCDKNNVRPTNLGYQFQIRVVIKGWCRVRGIVSYAENRMAQRYEEIVC